MRNFSNCDDQMVINSTNTNKTYSTTTSHLNSLNTQKTTTYDVGNPGPGLGQAQKCGGITSFNGIPTHANTDINKQ